MSFTRFVFTILFGIFAMSLTSAVDCVPDGGSVTVEKRRPWLPAGDDNCGFPSSQWLNDAPVAYECDTFSDDRIATAGAIGDTSGSVTIRNRDGSLIGPEGDTLNGGLEGSCIEVKICWNAKFCRVTQIGPGSFIRGYRTEKVCSDCCDVCPCEE